MTAARTAGRVVVYVALAAAIASLVAMIFKANWDGVVRFAVVSGVIFAARSATVPTPFAAAFSTFVLFATWAGAEHWYRQLSLLDVVIHFLTPGSLAAVAYHLLVQARLLPGPRDPAGVRRWSPVLWVTFTGTTAAVIWEYYEWVVEQIAPVGMIVGYTDTIVDLLAGMLGSLVAGALVLIWAHHRSPTEAAPG